jgi:hypothetical protein
LGVLWGGAVSAMQAVVLPLEEEAWSSIWRVVAWILPGWSAVGIGIAALIEVAGARVERPWHVAASVIGCSIGFGALWSLLYSFGAARDIAASGLATVFPHGIDPFAAFVYQTWTVLFYGGFYFLAWKLNHRLERSRELMGRLELARIDAEKLLHESQLALLRGFVDPELLLRAMAETERRFLHQGRKADALLRSLVAFLRLAMPGVRSGQSTLAGELALVAAYDELCAELESRPCKWSIAGGAPGIPFPPLLMLPLLDALAVRSPSCERLRIEVGREPEGVVVQLFGGAIGGDDWIPPQLRYRLRVSLSALFGDAWSMSQGKGHHRADAALLLRLRPEGLKEAAVDAGMLPA